MSPWLIVGLVALVATSVFELSAYSEQSTNGIIEECSYTNVAPYLFAPLAILAGLLAALRRRRQPGREQMHLTLGLVCLVIGTLQLVGTIAGVNVTVHDDKCEVGGPSQLGAPTEVSWEPTAFTDVDADAETTCT